MLYACLLVLLGLVLLHPVPVELSHLHIINIGPLNWLYPFLGLYLQCWWPCGLTFASEMSCNHLDVMQQVMVVWWWCVLLLNLVLINARVPGPRLSRCSLYIVHLLNTRHQSPASSILMLTRTRNEPSQSFHNQQSWRRRLLGPCEPNKTLC